MVLRIHQGSIGCYMGMIHGLRPCSSHITESSYIFAESVNNSEKNPQCLVQVVKHSRMDAIINYTVKDSYHFYFPNEKLVSWRR